MRADNHARRAGKRPKTKPKEKKEDLARTVEELRAEVEEYKRKERQFDEMIRFEKLLLEISAPLVNLPAEQVGREIENGLQRIV